MEQVGKLLKQSAILKRPATETTAMQSHRPNGKPPKWAAIMLQMAQDKRHDLAPAVVEYWRVKLSQFTEQEIADALMAYRGEYFPSVDAVIGLIEAQRDSRKVQDYQPIDRKAVEAEQSSPEWDESAERARSALRKLAGMMA